MQDHVAISQRIRAKKFKHLHYQVVEVYIGHVPCKYKHVLKELSLLPKSDAYGEYKRIEMFISRTHWNGKVVTITPQFSEHQGLITPFQIPYTVDPANDSLFNKPTWAELIAPHI